MRLVFIYGPPGAGKLTIGRELAAATGFKLFHNHLSRDAVEPVFEFGTPSFGRLVGKIRLEVIEEAARENLDGLVFTFVYAHPDDRPFVGRVVEAVERHGGEVCFVQLVCRQEELERRVRSGDRMRQRKVATVELLRELLERCDLSTPVPDSDTLSIDNTRLGPREAAEKIVNHFALGRGIEAAG